MTGLTSISFRGLRPEAIIRLAAEAGLKGIEWGSDVHVPPEDPAWAARIAAMTREAGLTVTSYGSYLKVLGEEGEQAAFAKLLTAAKQLQAPVIRVWAGDHVPEDTLPEQRRQVEAGLRKLVAQASAEGICVATEYHRGTLTQHAASTIQLLDAVPGLLTYWQPNPDITEAENLRELAAVRSRVCNIHVFHWTAPGDQRHPLSEGADTWKRYIRCIQEAGDFPHHFLLEFVKEDRPEQCTADAAVLNRLLMENQE